MKFATTFLAGFCLSASLCHPLCASESAPDCETAATTLSTGIKAEPSQLLLLFEDALQNNPGCRRDLFLTAINSSNPDADLLAQIIYVARNEFPDESSLFAEAALSEKPEFSDTIREAFMADDAAMHKALAEASESMEPATNEKWLAETQEMDEDIREAIARMNARIGGKPWPEQEIAETHFNFKKPDSVRTSGKASSIDESSLVQGDPVDQVDEQAIAEHDVRMNDRWKPSKSIHLDESRFAIKDPLEAHKKSIATAGKAGAPPMPTLPRSSVYYIPPPEDHYVSTVDYEKDEKQRPPLIIRSAPASPTSPK